MQGFAPYDSASYPDGAAEFAGGYVRPTSDTSNVPVPNFAQEHYSFQHASKVLQDLGMQVGTPRYDENSAARPGSVIGQEPPAAREGNPPGATIVLVVSGRDPLAAPSGDAGASGGAGVSVLGAGAGASQFRETDVVYSATGSEFAGDFMSELGAGFGSMFGGSTRTFRMPNVVGMSFEDAKGVLKGLGLRDGVADPVPQPSDEPAGHVLEQDPAAGAALEDTAAKRRVQPVRLKTSSGDPPAPAANEDDADEEDEAAAAAHPRGARAQRLQQRQTQRASTAAATSAAARTTAAAKKAAAPAETDVVFSGTGADFREEFSSAMFGGGVGGFFGNIFGVHRGTEFKVPDLAGKSRLEAETALKSPVHVPADMIDWTGRETHATVAAEKVTKTEPAAGTSFDLEGDTKLKIFFSTGPAPAPAVTPDGADGEGGRRASQRGGDHPEDTLDMDVLINRLAPRLLTQLRRELQTGRDRAGINTRS
jgi:beta-lactam-binding protein with PASTA domain